MDNTVLCAEFSILLRIQAKGQGFITEAQLICHGKPQAQQTITYCEQGSVLVYAAQITPPLSILCCAEKKQTTMPDWHYG